MKSYSFTEYMSKEKRKSYWKPLLGLLILLMILSWRTGNFYILLIMLPAAPFYRYGGFWKQHRCIVDDDGIGEQVGLKTIRSIKKDALSAVGAITNKDGTVLFFATSTSMKRIGQFLDQHEYMAVNLIGKQEFDQQCQTAKGRAGVALVVYILHFAKKYPTGMITLPCSRTDVDNMKPLCTQFWDIVL